MTQEMTVIEAAKFLRNAAEGTARMSQNWDNFEKIALDMIQAAFNTPRSANGGGGE